MKKIVICIALVLFALPVFAGPASTAGGRPLQTPTAHDVKMGWPSVSYEWWHSGKPDWAIGAEMVYGDWSGEFSDVDFGLALNLPLRWHVRQSGRTDIAFKLAPGALMGFIDRPGDDIFVLGLRGEMGFPITVALDDRVNLLTGVTVPFSVFIVEDADDFVVIPLLPRIGVEFAADDWITPYFLMELGPTIGVGSGNTDVELGLRAWVGANFF